MPSCREMWKESEKVEQTVTCNFNSKAGLFVLSVTIFLVTDSTSLGRPDTHMRLAACSVSCNIDIDEKGLITDLNQVNIFHVQEKSLFYFYADE